MTSKHTKYVYNFLHSLYKSKENNLWLMIFIYKNTFYIILNHSLFILQEIAKITDELKAN